MSGPRIEPASARSPRLAPAILIASGRKTLGSASSGSIPARPGVSGSPIRAGLLSTFRHFDSLRNYLAALPVSFGLTATHPRAFRCRHSLRRRLCIRILAQRAAGLDASPPEERGALEAVSARPKKSTSARRAKPPGHGRDALDRLTAAAAVDAPPRPSDPRTRSRGRDKKKSP